MKPKRSWRNRQTGTEAPWIIAHRGASALASENTPEAFEAAIAAGADGIEMDVRVTRDGVFVCYHDADLQRLSGKDLTVEALSFAELSGTSNAPIFPLHIVLEQLLDRCLLLLDVKFTSTARAKELGTLIAGYGTRETVCLGTRSLELQQAIASTAPTTPQLGFLIEPTELWRFSAAGGVWGRLWERDADTETILALHRLPMFVAIMVGEETEEGAGWITQSRLRKLLVAKPDALLLNNPADARVYVE